jgi:hypothetical protein
MSPSARPADLLFDVEILGDLARAARRSRDTLAEMVQAQRRCGDRAALTWAGGHRDAYDADQLARERRIAEALDLLDALVVGVARTMAGAEDAAVRRRREQADWDADQTSAQISAQPQPQTSGPVAARPAVGG